jgi:exopolysaccharide biosynthesis protein
MTGKKGASSLEWGELQLQGSGEAWRTRLVVARVDPERVNLGLDTAFTTRREAAWTLAHVPKRAVLAINAGQFEATMPWGWVVLHGHRWLPPQHGPLSAALLQDSSGTLHWIRGDDVARAAMDPAVRWAFQSYPALLVDDSVPAPLRASGGGVDVAHRDARAGVCLASDGKLLVALTRFDGAGRALHFVPFGLTVPEMAAVMGALGCRNAMLLDGGISARLRVRDANGVAHDWEGLRNVPLGLIALPR